VCKGLQLVRLQLRERNVRLLELLESSALLRLRPLLLLGRRERLHPDQLPPFAPEMRHRSGAARRGTLGLARANRLASGPVGRKECAPPLQDKCGPALRPDSRSGPAHHVPGKRP